MWFEARMLPDAELRDFYEELEETGRAQTYHHFYGEEWWKGAAVVRVETDEHTLEQISEFPGVDHVVEWDPTTDEKYFGPAWPIVKNLFCGFSQLNALFPPSKEGERKLIHCALNALHYDADDEIKFARVFLADRLWRVKRVDGATFEKIAEQNR